MNNSKLKTQNSKLLILLGLVAAAALVWLLYLYVFVWRDIPHLAQLVGA